MGVERWQAEMSELLRQEILEKTQTSLGTFSKSDVKYEMKDMLWVSQKQHDYMKQHADEMAKCESLLVILDTVHFVGGLIRNCEDGIEGADLDGCCEQLDKLNKSLSDLPSPRSEYGAGKVCVDLRREGGKLMLRFEARLTKLIESCILVQNGKVKVNRAHLDSASNSSTSLQDAWKALSRLNASLCNQQIDHLMGMLLSRMISPLLLSLYFDTKETDISGMTPESIIKETCDDTGGRELQCLAIIEGQTPVSLPCVLKAIQDVIAFALQHILPSLESLDDTQKLAPEIARSIYIARSRGLSVLTTGSTVDSSIGIGLERPDGAYDLARQSLHKAIPAQENALHDFIERLIPTVRAFDQALVDIERNHDREGLAWSNSGSSSISNSVSVAARAEGPGLINSLLVIPRAFAASKCSLVLAEARQLLAAKIYPNNNNNNNMTCTGRGNYIEDCERANPPVRIADVLSHDRDWVGAIEISSEESEGESTGEESDTKKEKKEKKEKMNAEVQNLNLSFHNCQVSSTVLAVVQLIYRVMDIVVASCTAGFVFMDARQVSKSNNNNNHHRQYRVASTYLCACTELIELFITMIPQRHQHKIDTSLEVGGVLHNDCLYLIHHVTRVSYLYHSQLSLLQNQSGNVSGSGKFRMFVDFVAPLRSLSEAVLWLHIKQQIRQGLVLLAKVNLSTKGVTLDMARRERNAVRDYHRNRNRNKNKAKTKTNTQASSSSSSDSETQNGNGSNLGLELRISGEDESESTSTRTTSAENNNNNNNNNNQSKNQSQNSPDRLANLLSNFGESSGERERERDSAPPKAPKVASTRQTEETPVVPVVKSWGLFRLAEKLGDALGPEQEDEDDDDLDEDEQCDRDGFDQWGPETDSDDEFLYVNMIWVMSYV